MATRATALIGGSRTKGLFPKYFDVSMYLSVFLQRYFVALDDGTSAFFSVVRRPPPTSTS
jgi:hypothetical protein